MGKKIRSQIWKYMITMAAQLYFDLVNDREDVGRS